jgi:hypothetical protein
MKKYPAVADISFKTKELRSKKKGFNWPQKTPQKEALFAEKEGPKGPPIFVWYCSASLRLAKARCSELKLLNGWPGKRGPES